MNRLICVLIAVAACHATFRPAFAETRQESSNPKSNEARWQSGQVRHDGQWVDFKELLSRFPTADVMNEYRAKRDSAQMTLRAQLDLANWCRSHKLKEQERAHLTLALE